MSWREITAEDLNSLKKAVIVDVRSPCEYVEEHIPNAINVPLFSDEERQTIGTIYALEGEVVARRQGLKIISPKIPELIDEILSKRTASAPLVVHCWRGGLRSESVASLLSIIGVDCWRLTGGYKAWRKELLSEFEDDPYAFAMVVLHGHTGAGKTEILSKLKEMGQSVLDLEDLANHRGSVFGALGLGPQPTQKNFDASIWQAVRTFPPGLVFVEAEGKKIGRLTLPKFVYDRIQYGARVLVEGSLGARCQRIVRDYTEGSRQLSSAAKEQALHSLDAIKERLGGQKLAEVKRLAEVNDLSSVVAILLADYYDPLYSKGIANYQPYELTVNGDEPQAAAEAIVKHCSAIASAAACKITRF
ncbi:tRNA 2-selenouridine(34) synthase MnmH [bacterium]|nr:tRNA 2-selenouridine(34) synthase MnmH [bacterium]